jgi:tRNA A-37 threonylcarbamoyl transferase component Bud32
LGTKTVAQIQRSRLLYSALRSGGISSKRLLEYDAVSIDEGLGEIYVSKELEGRKIPIYEDSSKSTHNSTPKDLSYKNTVDCSIYKFENMCTFICNWGNAVAQLVEALRYKPEGHEFDSR